MEVNWVMAKVFPKTADPTCSAKVGFGPRNKFSDIKGRDRFGGSLE
jgi:hypothetical protein